MFRWNYFADVQLMFVSPKRIFQNSEYSKIFQRSALFQLTSFVIPCIHSQFTHANFFKGKMGCFLIRISTLPNKFSR